MTNQPTVNVITIKELASELYINAKSLRKKLRDNSIVKPSTRWEWPEDHESVLTIRSWKDQPVKTKKSSKEGKAQIALEKLKEIHKPIAEEQDPRTLPHIEKETSAKPELETIFEKSTKSGKWVIKQGEQGVRAYYTSPSTTDATKWINEESEIRPTLPKYIQEEIKKALAS